MDRVTIIKRHRAIRRLTGTNPLATAEERLSMIADVASGKLSPADAVKVRKPPASVEETARKARGGRDRMARGGLDRVGEA